MWPQAMGRDQDTVFVDTERTGRDAITYLKDQKVPPMTFVPLTTCKVRGRGVCAQGACGARTVCTQGACGARTVCVQGACGARTVCTQGARVGRGPCTRPLCLCRLSLPRYPGQIDGRRPLLSMLCGTARQWEWSGSGAGHTASGMQAGCAPQHPHRAGQAHPRAAAHAAQHRTPLSPADWCKSMQAGCAPQHPHRAGQAHPRAAAHAAQHRTPLSPADWCKSMQASCAPQHPHRPGQAHQRAAAHSAWHCTSGGGSGAAHPARDGARLPVRVRVGWG